MLTHWVRDRQSGRLSVAEAVRELTSAPARVAGLKDRGRIALGYKADLNIIDAEALRLHRPVVVGDLPAGGRRLDQTADGYVATIVSGEVIAENGVPDRRPARQVDPGPSTRSGGMTRVAPLAPPWSAEDAAGINSWGHPDRTYEPLLLVRCLQRHPALAAKLRKLGEALYIDTVLPPRVRTIAILRICALRRMRLRMGRAGGVLGSDRRGQRRRVRRVGHRRRISGWSAEERTLISAVDELERTGSWSTDTWNALGASLSDEQRMELLIAVGWYRTICTLCNGLELPVEGWMRRWPPSAA